MGLVLRFLKFEIDEIGYGGVGKPFICLQDISLFINKSLYDFILIPKQNLRYKLEFVLNTITFKLIY